MKTESLLEAAIQGDSLLVREILQQGTDPDSKDQHGETALTWAAHLGHTGVVKDLLAAGANRETIGQFLSAPPLLLAAHRGHRGIVALLAVLSDVNARNSRGATALMLTLEPAGTLPKPAHRMIPIIETLLHAGAEVNLQDQEGDTALMVAARWGHLDAARVLLMAGADPHLKNHAGQTALTLARQNQTPEWVTLLENP